ncbi:MAG: type II secretion system minor pseudopilin GspK [Pseudomonadota bacterium]
MIARERSSERGAALVTVLMIVAVMSAVALGLSQSVLASTERARSLDAQAQLRLYAAAAEEVAKAQLTELALQTGGRLSSDLPGFGEVQTIPVDGGSVRVQVRDKTNCFNVNTESTGTAQSDEAGEQSETLVSILEGAGLAQGDAVALSAAVGDWIDENRISRTSGAEDAYYLGLSLPYRTSSQPLANLTELLAIRGFDRDTFEDLRPILCVLPEHTANPSPALNLNTLEAKDATRLRWAVSGAIEDTEARSIILSRPLGGWPDVDTFLQDPIVARIAPEQIRLNRLSVVSSLLEVDAEVAYRDEVMQIRLLFELEAGQPVRVLRRERIS